MRRAQALAAALVAGLLGGNLAYAQAGFDSNITVTPLPELPPVGDGIGLTLDPEMGLVAPGPEPGVLVTDPLFDENGGFIEGGPASDDGVALIERQNPRAAASVSRPATSEASGANLRALDKTLGTPTDIEMQNGETVVFGRIGIRLLACRYPIEDPASDAFAQLQIVDLQGHELFRGWMVASSPALMALEHPRYDVWVLSCRTAEAGTGSG